MEIVLFEKIKLLPPFLSNRKGFFVFWVFLRAFYLTMKNILKKVA